MMGDKVGLTKLYEEFKKQIELQKNSNYPHDEETLLYHVFIENRNLFHLVINKMRINLLDKSKLII